MCAFSLHGLAWASSSNWDFPDPHSAVESLSPVLVRIRHQPWFWFSSEPRWVAFPC
jgi:hypothetical protein